jgi:hypothetical protein
MYNNILAASWQLNGYTIRSICLEDLHVCSWTKACKRWRGLRNGAVDGSATLFSDSDALGWSTFFLLYILLGTYRHGMAWYGMVWYDIVWYRVRGNCVRPLYSTLQKH